MKEVLEDARLVTLQREGGAVLARMRREDFRFPQSEDYRYQGLSPRLFGSNMGKPHRELVTVH